MRNFDYLIDQSSWTDFDETWKPKFNLDQSSIYNYFYTFKCHRFVIVNTKYVCSVCTYTNISKETSQIAAQFSRIMFINDL